MRILLLASGLLALAGCQTEQVAATPARLITAEPLPVSGLWLELDARTGHNAPAGHAAPVAWAPATWVVSEGAMVAVGDPLLRLDVVAMQQWNDQDSFDLTRNDQRRKLELLQADGEIERLQSRLRQLQATRVSIAAELADASRIDNDEVRIAELQFADAQREYAACVLRRERLDRLLAAGAPVSGSDLARAREEESRSRAALAAPEVTLELARLPAARSTVRRLELTLADIDAQLGSTPAEGLSAEIRTAEERRARRVIDRGRGERRRRNVERRAAAIADPVVEASEAGIAVLRDADMRAGSKLPAGVASILVYGADGMVAAIAVPERQRPLVEVGAAVAMTAPALAGQQLAGRVASISIAPETRGDGQRMFTAMVELVDPPESVKPGMTLQVRLAVDASASGVSIPSFCVADPASPAVVLADGSTRAIQGFQLGSRFVVLSGLAAGDEVVLPQKPAGDGLRLSALVEPASFVPVSLRSWDWEVVELLPEGTKVQRGDRLARLAKVELWRDPDQIRTDAEQNLAQARLDLSVDLLSATDIRAAAQAAWVRARIALARARLAAWVGRNAYDAVAQARSEAAVTAAVLNRERAERELVAAEAEHAVGGLSAGSLGVAHGTLAKSVLALDRARLDAAAIELGLSLPDQRQRDNDALAAAENEEAQRQQSVIASEAYRARIAGSAARFEGTRRWVDSDLRNLADEVIVAPADGILVHGLSWDGPPRVGRRLETWEPFRIADGSVRKVVFEVPIRWFGRIAVDDRLRIAGPGAEAGFEATVTKVGSALLPPSGFADEVALGRTIGVEDRIFQVTVTFTPTEPGQLPPGSTAHVILR